MARRSVLFSPGDQPDLLRKATESGADVVVFDLEDAVAPGRKADARDAVTTVLDEQPTSDETESNCEVCVRINALEAGGDTDLDALASATLPDSIMLPKVTAETDLDTLESHRQTWDRHVPVLALLETAAGILHAQEIAAHKLTDAVLFGAEDLAADIGATRTKEGEEIRHARQHTVLAAGAAGVDAIDTLYTDFRDLEGLRADTERAVTYGFDGKMAIHPDQVTVINDAFTPDSDEIAWATRVLDARDEASVQGKGVFAVDGEMIDAPLISQAETILERAKAAEDSDV